MIHPKPTVDDEFQIFEIIIFLWLNIMSFFHWANLLAVPITMLWPHLFPSPSFFLWVIEFAFILDIVRKCFTKKPKSLAVDSYDIFVEYIKSNLIIDLFSSVPNTFSGMNNKFTFLKVIRMYEIDMLYYTLSLLMRRTLH